MIKIYLRHDDVSLCTNMYIVLEHANGERILAKPVTLEFEPLNEATIPLPTLQFRQTQATSVLQSLADELALMGFTPAKTKDSQSQLEAVKYHLEDMRRLIFKHNYER